MTIYEPNDETIDPDQEKHDLIGHFNLLLEGCTPEQINELYRGIQVLKVILFRTAVLEVNDLILLAGALDRVVRGPGFGEVRLIIKQGHVSLIQMLWSEAPWPGQEILQLPQSRKTSPAK